MRLFIALLLSLAFVGQANAKKPTCPPKPPNKTQTNACPVGFVGSWTQVQTPVANAYPKCWTYTALSPTNAPVGSCVAAVEPIPPVPPVVVMPPIVDHSKMGPYVDPKLIPPAVVPVNVIPPPTIPPTNLTYVLNGPRIKTTYTDMTKWYDPATGQLNSSCTGWGAHCARGVLNPSCTAPNTTTCVQPATYAPTPDPTIGAFRVTTKFAKMLYDDPIVYFGQPGISHLHTFTSNAEVNAFSTAESIAACKASTAAGGTLNCSSYWFPSLIDTLNGQPLTPSVNVVYYKGSYEFDISKLVQAMPTGLRMVSGNAGNTDPTKTGARYGCTGNAGTSAWFKTITELVGNSACIVGADMLMEVGFPNCWDGVNLDSPSHSAHMSYAVQDQTSPFAKHCPATHPVVIPVISYNVHYLITDTGMLSRVRLSSDVDPNLPAGISGHGDWFMGWDKATLKTFVTNCLVNKFDCHANLLGDGRTLY